MLSPAKNQKNRFQLFYAIGLGLELGFLIALPLVIFLLLGIYLDKKFQTFPTFLVFAIIIGIVLTFLDVYYLVLPFLDRRYKK
jgi:F0F1-type ATP synthase assembly protein I